MIQVYSPTIDDLQRKLAWMIGQRTVAAPKTTKCDVLVTPMEINTRHGTGVLLMKIFGQTPNLVSIRTINYYGSESYLGEKQFVLAHAEPKRREAFQNVQSMFRETEVQRIVCIPFFPDDLLTAVALKEIYQAPLCIYIMDDHNVVCPVIPDALMEEALSKADLRLVISPEMRDAYQNKYRKKCWVVPPVVSADIIPPRALPVRSTEPTGVLVGNIWNPDWLRDLRTVVRESKTKLHWYGNGTSAQFADLDVEALSADGIELRGHIPERELVPLLREYTFAVIPSAVELDGATTFDSIARLSIPSRVPFLMSAGQLPILVLGNPNSAVARFIQRFELGQCIDYSAREYADAVRTLTQMSSQQKVREIAAELAPTFSCDGLADWIWNSLQRGEPIDERFEELFKPRKGEFAYYIDPPVQQGVFGDVDGTYQALRRLKARGWKPDFVLDVGSSTGIWSHSMSYVFPDARYLLFDPLLHHYDQDQVRPHLDAHPNFEPVVVALGEKRGKIPFHLTPNLFGSSFLEPIEESSDSEIEVELTTLDHVANERGLAGRGLLKIDVQGAEHLVLAGAKETLKQIDVVILELSLYEIYQEGKTYLEMLKLMESLGFSYYDDVGEWRSPVDGRLQQKDVLFARKLDVLADPR